MTTDKLLVSETTGHIIGAFFDVYNTLGYGFLERIYADALEIELIGRSRKVQREALIPVWYKGKKLSLQRVDMIVDDQVVLELKSTALLSRDADRQLFNYVRATTISVGMLLHFGPKPRFYRRLHSDKSFVLDPR
jgi:GxxExxY protein